MSEHENSIDIDGLCCTECFYQGRVAERERIIALLEAERWELPDGMPAGGEIYMPIEQAIALIRGQ